MLTCFKMFFCFLKHNCSHTVWINTCSRPLFAKLNKVTNVPFQNWQTIKTRFQSEWDYPSYQWKGFSYLGERNKGQRKPKHQTWNPLEGNCQVYSCISSHITHSHLTHCLYINMSISAALTAMQLNICCPAWPFNKMRKSEPPYRDVRNWSWLLTWWGSWVERSCQVPATGRRDREGGRAACPHPLFMFDQREWCSENHLEVKKAFKWQSTSVLVDFRISFWVKTKVVFSEFSSLCVCVCVYVCIVPFYVSTMEENINTTLVFRGNGKKRHPVLNIANISIKIHPSMGHELNQHQIGNFNGRLFNWKSVGLPHAIMPWMLFKVLFQTAVIRYLLGSDSYNSGNMPAYQ